MSGLRKSARRTKLAAVAAVGIAAALLLSACSSSSKSASAPAAAVGSGSTSASASSTASGGNIVIAAPECAHCLAMALLSNEITGYKVSFQSFGTLTELTAGLAAGRIDVGQIDYTGLVSLIDKGLPIVAISGEVNGGSDFVLSPKIGLAAGDWTGFTALAKKDKADGHKLTIASQFGTVQDIELRLQLPKYGLNPNTDVNMVNVPYQGMAQALKSGSAQAAIPVQPFAASITNGGFGKHFAYPYDQAAGNLTNVVVVTKSFITAHPDKVAAIIAGMTKLVPYLKTPAGQTAWEAQIAKYTGVSAADIATAMPQLEPAIAMPFTQIQAIAAAMYQQKLIATNPSATTLQDHVDYDPLAKSTGQSAQTFGAAQ